MNAPDKALEIKAAVTGLIALGTALFGWVGWVIVIWLIAMALDYITGTLSAISLGEWSSAVARKGLWHKLGSIAAVLVASLCDIALGVVTGKLPQGFLPDYGCIITPVVVLWYVFTELGSIVENAAKLGAPLPKFLIKLIENARKATESKVEK